MAKLTMNARPEKAAVNNSGEKAVGIELYLDQIVKAEPFASLFTIKPEVLAAIKADMRPTASILPSPSMSGRSPTAPASSSTATRESGQPRSSAFFG